MELVCLGAAKGGHLDILVWAKKQGYRWYGVDILTTAAQFGQEQRKDETAQFGIGTG